MTFQRLDSKIDHALPASLVDAVHFAEEPDGLRNPEFGRPRPKSPDVLRQATAAET